MTPKRHYAISPWKIKGNSKRRFTTMPKHLITNDVYFLPLNIRQIKKIIIIAWAHMSKFTIFMFFFQLPKFMQLKLNCVKIEKNCNHSNFFSSSKQKLALNLLKTKKQTTLIAPDLKNWVPTTHLNGNILFFVYIIK